MESDHLGHDVNPTDETSLKQLFPPDSLDVNEIVGNQQVNPRIGDEYQVEIPPMITGSEHIELLMNPYESGCMFHDSHFFLMGLSVPIIWLRDDLANADDTINYKRTKKRRASTGKKGSKLNALKLNDRRESEPENFESKTAGTTNFDRLCKCTSYSSVPALLGNPWSDAEKDIFLLGLYIFGKNFYQIQRFVETKDMGDILSFYYGEFYRSDGYCRWSDCRKPRSRKCLYGEKIFSGWRQQELLSRLLPHVPEDSQNTLLEVSKSFAEGRTSLESYVFHLKAMVGFPALVESVGIGKGKEDLTRLAMEPVKTTQVFPVYPKMPSGKACASLTSADIIEFLTGDFRLSKTRCNYIFWEGVWPRLLARGWHSEQPKSQRYLSSKDNLVFLMPGVKKFSRRKLVKGDHYFDSVSDILKKVASDPKLIELEPGEAGVSDCNKENQWVQEEISDQDNPSNPQPHCYLKPLTSDCNLEQMKFMVVDSSLIHGGQSPKVRALRYLPLDFRQPKLTHIPRTSEGLQLEVDNIPLSGEKNSIAEHSMTIFDTHHPDSMKLMVVDTSLVHRERSAKVRVVRYCSVESKLCSGMKFLSRINAGNSSDEPLHGQESNAAGTLLNSESDASDTILNGNTYSDSLLAFYGATSEKVLNSDSGNNMEIHQDNEANKWEDRTYRRIIKHHFSRRAKSDKTNSLVPFIKRRRLTACAKTEMSSFIGSFSNDLDSKEVGPCCELNLQAGYNYVSQLGTSVDKISSFSYSGECKPEEGISGGMVISESCFSTEMPYEKNEKHEIPSSIDFNVSQIPFDLDNVETLPMEVEDSQGMNPNASLVEEKKLNLEAVKTSVDVDAAPQQPNVNPTRRSTRNRPLTAKALEALACGLFNFKSKEKGKELLTQEIPFSNPSRKARSRLKPSSKRGSAHTGIMDLKEEKEVNRTSIVNEDTIIQPTI